MAAPGSRRKLVFAAVAVAGALAGLELAARLFEQLQPPLAVDYGLGFDPASRLFEPTDDAPHERVTRPSKRRFFHDQRFRADKPDGTLRLVAVGGSSVYYARSELLALARNLEASLADRVDRVEVLNAGGLAYGSHRLVPIVAELLAYQPDVLLLYTGHNEFEEVEQLELAQRGAPEVERALSGLALFRVLRDGVTRTRVAHLASEHDARILAADPPQARAWNTHFTPAQIDARMAAYRRNLERIIAACREAGVPLVIGTVPSNLVRPMLPARGNEAFREVFAMYGRGEHAAGAARARALLRAAGRRHQSSDAENEIIRALAREYGLLLADVERAVVRAEPNGVPGETLFRDHCHLNARGNRLWRRSYESALAELFL